MRSRRSERERALPQIGELASLPEVHRDRDDLGAVVLREPGMAIEVSSPPEYPRTIRSIVAPVTLSPTLPGARELTRVVISSKDDEDRIVAADRADDVGHLGAVERNGQRLRLSRIGSQHDELMNRLHASEELGDGAPKRNLAPAGRGASAPGLR